MKPLKKLLRRLAEFWLRDVIDAQQRTLLLLGREHAARARALPDRAPLRDAEFRVFSQWGEDGILQYLASRVPIAHDYFVEFGVEDYTEANTRFLLMNDNWAGLVLDGSAEHVARIRDERSYWRHALVAEQAFITRENIDSLLARHIRDADIGLLSIDLDGNDYWVWEAISVVRPRIVVCEYNSLFGPDAAVSIPYDRNFHRTRAHHSNLYWGASLAALCHLGLRKKYVLVGVNSAGNNAFFVRDDCASRLRPVLASEAYVRARYREARDARGRLRFVSAREGAAGIGQLPLVDVVLGSSTTVGAVLGGN
jgi:hypothetical protein